MRNPLGAESLRILGLAARPEGVTSAEVKGVTALRRLKYRGDLVMVPRWKASRYFATQAAADAWARANPDTGLRETTTWTLNLPGTPKSLRRFDKAKAAQPFTGQVTKCPDWTHDPRYTVGPGERVPALFSALPIGSYLEG